MILRAFPNPFTKRTKRELKQLMKDVGKQSRLAVQARGEKKVCLSAFDFNVDNPRVEVFVCLFNRCHDPPALCTHECLLDRELFTPNCVTKIRDRLGWARTHDALFCCQALASLRASGGLDLSRCGAAAFSDGGDGSPHSALPSAFSAARTLAQMQGQHAQQADAGTEDEPIIGRRYSIHLDKYEEWIIARYLVNVHIQEKGEHFAKCNWSQRGFLAEQGFDFFIPAEWADKTPHEGTLSCIFITEDNSRLEEKTRRKLAERLLAWEPS